MLSDKAGKRLYDYVPDYVIFDLETTGISTVYDEVIEISAVKVRKGQVADEFTTLVNPRRTIPYGASAVNGITDAMVKDQPTFQQVLPDFVDFIEDLPLVGHNIHSFDMKFLYRDCPRFLGKTISNNYIDTLTMARQNLPRLSHHKLTDLAEYYGISSVGAHRALNDCRMNQQVFERLAKEKKPVPSATEKTCPRCGSPMRRRNGKFGEFWGCSGYPSCRYTENI